MKFDPSVEIRNHAGEALDDGKLTTGQMAIYALDATSQKADGKTMRRQFRIATEIQAAIDLGTTLEIKEDELELIEERLVDAVKSPRLANGTLIFGAFMQAVADMKAEEADRQGKEKPNGATEAAALQ